jgi:hypothetical protein
MKTPLSFYLVAAVAGTLACSDEGGTTRGSGGTGTVVAQAGSGGASGGAAGSGQNMAGSGGGNTTSGPKTGAAFEITAGDATENGVTGLVVDRAGTTGIDGIAQVIKSPLGTTVTSTIKDGALCMQGTTVVVPNMDYTNYWGAEIDLDLKLVDSNGNGSAPTPVADAGADAGDAGSSGPPPARTPTGWNASASNVVGFSFKITGPTVPTAFRFKGLPYGADPAAVTYCNQVAATDGATLNINFSQITFECWNPAGAAVLSMPYPPDNPDGKLLRTISWQVPADVNIPFPFDFCVSEIKPLLAN